MEITTWKEWVKVAFAAAKSKGKGTDLENEVYELLIAAGYTPESKHTDILKFASPAFKKYKEANPQ